MKRGTLTLTLAAALTIPNLVFALPAFDSF